MTAERAEPSSWCRAVAKERCCCGSRGVVVAGRVLGLVSAVAEDDDAWATIRTCLPTWRPTVRVKDCMVLL